MRPREFLLGDQVTARQRYGRTAGRRVRGRISGLDCGEGDKLERVIVHTGGDRFVEVKPTSVRYRTGLHGFGSRYNPDGSLTIFRNDDKMLSPDWWWKGDRTGYSGAAQLHNYLREGRGHAKKKTR